MTDLDRSEKALEKLYEEIRQVFTSEWEAIYEIFPNPISVIQDFTQRVFGQTIQNALDDILTPLMDGRTGLFLQELAMCHAATAELVDDIRRFDEAVIFVQTGKKALDQLIDRAFTDLFVPYTNGDKYLDLEKSWLMEIFEDELGELREYMVIRD